MRKFQSRFEYVEDELAARGKKPRDSNLEEMDAFWEESKARVRKK
jgi:ATP diphosphatase